MRIEAEEFEGEIGGFRSSFGVHLFTYEQAERVIRAGGALDVRNTPAGVWVQTLAQLDAVFA